MIRRLPGAGWLVLVGGGEFSFGETLEADDAWMRVSPPGTVGFLPTASGSSDYGHHFAEYLTKTFQRNLEVIPIYRERDARRGRNLERIAGAAVLYLGGGMADELLGVVAESPAAEAMAARLAGGGTVVAIAAAAQALGSVTRSLRGDERLAGLGWLPGGAIETNFSPAHDRRLRELLAAPEAEWGVGIPAGSALLLGPEGELETAGTVFTLDHADGDLKVLGA